MCELTHELLKFCEIFVP